MQRGNQRKGEKKKTAVKVGISPPSLVFPSALPFLNFPPLCRLLLFMVRLKCLSVRPYSTAILQLCQLSHMKKSKRRQRVRRWRLRERRVQRGKPTGGGGEGNADFCLGFIGPLSPSSKRCSSLASFNCNFTKNLIQNKKAAVPT